MISNPKGRVLASAPSDLDEVKVVDIDIEMARDKAVTPRNDAFADRRPEEYSEIVKSLWYL